MARTKKKRRFTADKAVAQRIHAQRRCLQRTGIVLTTELHDQLTAKIQNRRNTATLVEKQSNRVSVWDVTHTVSNKEITFRIVYDKMRRNITTILNNVGQPELFLFDVERSKRV